MSEGFPKKIFSDAEIAKMLPDAEANEMRQRALTNNEASEDTQDIFEDEEKRRFIEDANPDKPALHEVEEQEQSAKEKERARQAIEKIRATLRAQEPERPDYDHPPISK